MNIKKLLSSKSAEYLRKRFNATDEQIVKTEIYYQNRYTENDVSIIDFDINDCFDAEELFQHYLRANTDF